MKLYKISRGYNIPIRGAAEKKRGEISNPGTAGITPSEFRGIKPGLSVSEGDRVKIGSPLFYDKQNQDLKFCSPVSGKVSEIVYGPRKVLERIILTREGGDALRHKSYSRGEISSLARGELISHMREGGVWPYLRQRPFNKIADPSVVPSSIFINGMDTAPLAADPEFALEGEEEAFFAGVEALKVLGEGRVHLVVDGKKSDSWFLKAEGVQKAAFTGKHPAGLVGTHISQIDPIHGHKVVWYLNARDVAMVGSFLLEGVYPTRRTYAIAGAGARERSYIQAFQGVGVKELLESTQLEEEVRILSGNILSGKVVAREEFIGFYDSQLTILPDAVRRSFFGWVMPGFNRPSASRAFASALTPGRSYPMNTLTNGEPRALVMTGRYRKVVALDVYPDFLVKAILAEDIEQMEQLGLLESDPEDYALCSYICPSKVEFTEIIQKGLDLFEADAG